MRDKQRDRGRLLHMQQAMENIHEFLDGRSAEDFLTDKMLYFAIVKNMENLGEAAYMLTNEFKDKHRQTPWKEIINMRHILVHGYYQIDSRIVWATIKNDLPSFELQIRECLSED